MAKKPAKQGKKHVVRTKADVAAALSVTRSAVTQWSRSWPFGHFGPFDVDAIRQWHAANVARSDRPASADATDLSNLPPLQRAGLIYKTRQSELLKIEIDELRGDLVSRQEVQRESEAAVLIFRNNVMQAGSYLADQLDSMGLLSPNRLEEAEAAIKKWAASVLAELEQKLTHATGGRDNP